MDSDNLVDFVVDLNRVGKYAEVQKYSDWPTLSLKAKENTTSGTKFRYLQTPKFGAG